MTEQHPAPAAPSAPPAVLPVPPVPPARSKERRDLIIAGALLAVAALAGGGYALFGSGSGSGGGKPAARSAATAAPGHTAARSYGVTAGGTHYGDLGELLLPPQPMLKPGPDVEQYGNDTVLDAAQAKAMAEGGDGAADLSARERRQADAELDAMHIKGAALRTFRRFDGSDTYAITIVQVGSKLAAGAAPEAFRKLSQGSDVFGRGPAVPGHPHAVCVVPGSAAASGDDWLQGMYCQATEGDLMVTFRVEGPRVNRSQAVALMAKQLDRIQAPGEGV
nr:hypothetical protein OH826_29880 [Streptomyces sp. NBC_00899]